METALDPIIYKDLAEAKAALARHGIVIIRSIETDLGPAIIAEARNRVASSPQVLRGLDEEQLDALMEDLRKKAMRSAANLRKLYTRVLAQLGTEYIGDLVKELDGISALFTWDRVEKSVDTVNARLSEAGFDPIALQDPEAVSESFSLELSERWPRSFATFRQLADEAARQLEGPTGAAEKRTPARKRSGKKSTRKKKKGKGGGKKPKAG
ncbi:MAG: hypothetical protein JSV90_00945 [Methanobacteriota archaeon]|nr:MAG: hypothetical protein JSV90_00945 [Euryarchaeota archaeon]